MRANLDITKGLIVSEAVMMGLGPHLGRQYAHDLVYDVCRKVVATGRPLAELLAENEEIAKHHEQAPRSQSSAIRRTTSARPARWSTACWRCDNAERHAQGAGKAARKGLTCGALCAFLRPGLRSHVSHERIR